MKMARAVSMNEPGNARQRRLSPKLRDRTEINSHFCARAGPRRRRCRTSSRSGNNADTRPSPPAPLRACSKMRIYFFASPNYGSLLWLVTAIRRQPAVVVIVENVRGLDHLLSGFRRRLDVVRQPATKTSEQAIRVLDGVGDRCRVGAVRNAELGRNQLLGQDPARVALARSSQDSQQVFLGIGLGSQLQGSDRPILVVGLPGVEC